MLSKNLNLILKKSIKSRNYIDDLRILITFFHSNILRKVRH